MSISPTRAATPTSRRILRTSPLPQRTYLNAFVSISGNDERWEVRLGGTNLTDKARAAQSFNTAEFSGVETAFMGAPRLYDIRLLLRFD